MPDLSVKYLGLDLRNPIIAGSSTHTISLDSVKRLEKAGVGAVVLKSIFEEQIRADVAGLYEALEESPHPAAYEYIRADLPMRIGPQKYLDRLREIRDAVDVPVIASVNCVSAARWVEFAGQVEHAGAHAIELNIYDISDEPDAPGSAVEARHAALVKAVKAEVKIPVAAKIAPFYSSLIAFARGLCYAGAGGLVLFNRFFQPDIDADNLTLRSAVNLSRPEDMLLPLRWVAILRDLVSCDLCLSTGVHSGKDAAKAILAGADAVQICSVLYKEGLDGAGRVVAELAAWMDSKGFKRVDDFRGLLREKDIADKRGFERAQYIKAFAGLE